MDSSGGSFAADVGLATGEGSLGGGASGVGCVGAAGDSSGGDSPAGASPDGGASWDGVDSAGASGAGAAGAGGSSLAGPGPHPASNSTSTGHAPIRAVRRTQRDSHGADCRLRLPRLTRLPTGPRLAGGHGPSAADGDRLAEQFGTRRNAIPQQHVLRFVAQRPVLAGPHDPIRALAGRRFLSEQVRAQERATTAQRQLAELARRRYNEGVVSYIEVLDAERNLFAAEQALLQVRRSEVSNLVSLYIALGGGQIAAR